MGQQAAERAIAAVRVIGEVGLSLSATTPERPTAPGRVDRDQALLEALRRRDPASAERLVETYGDRAYRLAMRITRNAQDAEEIVQDALWTIVRRAPPSRSRQVRVMTMTRHYLVACDFDQTLSFNDSGAVLGELIGASGFADKVAGLSSIHLVQQGAELAYLLRHDPDFRCVRREHLVETGNRVRLKKDIRQFVEILHGGIDDCRFSFHVVSAAPKAVIESALEGIVPPAHIHGAEFEFDASSGEICAITRVAAGYGKVAVVEELEAELQVSPDRTVYVGDGSSDVHVMLQVNRRDGLTIAVSEAQHIAGIAKRTVVSDSALSVLVPILEDVAGWDVSRIRGFFQVQGLILQKWGRARTDWFTIRDHPQAELEGVA